MLQTKALTFPVIVIPVEERRETGKLVPFTSLTDDFGEFLESVLLSYFWTLRKQS